MVVAAALPAAGATAWWLRQRRKPDRQTRPGPATRPEVDAQLVGPEQRPQLVSHDGPALHVGIDIAGPRPGERPTATISRENHHG